MPEIELHRWLNQSPEKGLKMIMDCYLPLVYAIVRGKLANAGTKQDIEECVSDTFYELYSMRARIDLSKGSIMALLAVLARRKAIDRYRTLRPKASELSLDENDTWWVAGPTDLEADLIQQEVGDALVRSVKSLGPPDSEIIVRRYFFGESAKTIGAALQLKENTVNKRAGRALAKLRESLGGVLHGETD